MTGVDCVCPAIVLGGWCEVVHAVDIAVHVHEVSGARISQCGFCIGVAIHESLFQYVAACDGAASESHCGTACITGVGLDRQTTAFRALSGKDASLGGIDGISQCQRYRGVIGCCVGTETSGIVDSGVEG